MVEKNNKGMPLKKAVTESAQETLEFAKVMIIGYKYLLKFIFSVFLIIFWLSGYEYISETLNIEKIDLLGSIYFIGWALKIWFGKGIENLRNLILGFMTYDTDLLAKVIFGEDIKNKKNDKKEVKKNV